MPKALAAAQPLGEVNFEGADYKECAAKVDKLLDSLDPERGEIRVTYAVEKDAEKQNVVLTSGKGFRFIGSAPQGLTFEVGGASVDSSTVLYNRENKAEWKTAPFKTTKGEYTVILRWSREPVMREIALVAKNGQEFLLGANNFIPWRPTAKAAGPSGVRLVPPETSGVTIRKLAVFIRTNPPPVEHSAVIPHMFDGSAWEKANAK